MFTFLLTKGDVIKDMLAEVTEITADFNAVQTKKYHENRNVNIPPKTSKQKQQQEKSMNPSG